MILYYLGILNIFPCFFPPEIWHQIPPIHIEYLLLEGTMKVYHHLQHNTYLISHFVAMVW
jgi:hypothetical protein